MAKAKITYDKAYAELNQILDDIQSEDVSIDQIAIKSKRANELLKFCREKLRTIESQVAENFDDEEEE